MGQLDMLALARPELIESTPGAQGERVVLGDLWRERETPLVLVWLRHYG
jgi:hypothetical protein